MAHEFRSECGLKVLKPDDLYRFKNVGDAQVSPDGAKILFVVSQADKKTDGSLTNIWLADVSARSYRRFTSSDKDRHPRWSPDGRRFAFVSSRSGRAQIWIADMAGGESWHLETEQRIGGAPLWSPSGRYILFPSKDFVKTATWFPYPGAPWWDRRRAEFQAKKALAGTNRTKSSVLPDLDISGLPGGIESEVKVITGARYRFDGVGYLGDLANHFFMVNVPDSPGQSGKASGAVRRLTHGDYNHLEAAFSPDGRYLAVVAQRSENAEYLQKQDLWLTDVSTGRTSMLLEGLGTVRAPSWSPGGDKIAFLGHDGSFGGSTTEGLWVLEVEAFVRDFEGNRSRSAPKCLTLCDAVNLTKGLDRPMGDRVSSDMRQPSGSLPYFWEDPKTIVFLACDKGATGLFQVSVYNADKRPGESWDERSATRKIWHDPHRSVSALSRAAGFATKDGSRAKTVMKTCVLQIGSPTEPDNLYLFNPDAEKGKRLRQFTDFNGWLSEFALGQCKRFTYKGDEDWDVDGWLLDASCTEKDDKAKDQKDGTCGSPAVLFIHGGPHGVYGSAFMFQCQIFASRGYTVLYTNPRGSQSYGQNFAYACVKDWGGAYYRDIMAGMDHVVSLGTVDPANLFITGWSYGGYMTSWAITQTRRFKAAVAGAIISNRYSFWGTTDIPMFCEHHCGGFPWASHQDYFERSAIDFAPNVDTPVMFIHGEEDLRCPISQSEEFFMALKYLGKTAVFIRYPAEFHSFVKPSHKFDRFERMISWFDHYKFQPGCD